jgi:WD40 repeat protein
MAPTRGRPDGGAHRPHRLGRPLPVSPDDTTLASASNDGTIRLWHVATGECRTSLRVAGPATGIAWHPNGSLLATGGGAGAYLFHYLT